MAFRFDVKIDPSALKTRTLQEAKNLAYSTSQALNATAKDAQTAERVLMDRTFKLRRAGFMYRLVKIFQFSNARQGIPFVEMGIDQKPRVLLGTFEGGGPREPMVGKNVAVPITGQPARPSPYSSVPARFTFQGMKFEKHTTADGKEQWKGENGTFLIPGVGVFQRTGKKQKQPGRARRHFVGTGGRVLWDSRVVKLLYKLMAPGQIRRLPASLHFVDTVRKTAEQKFTGYFSQFYNRFRR